MYFEFILDALLVYIVVAIIRSFFTKKRVVSRRTPPRAQTQAPREHASPNADANPPVIKDATFEELP